MRGLYMLFSPDGTILATATLDIYSDYVIELWDVQSGRSYSTINGTGWLDALSFSADGNVLLAARSIKFTRKPHDRVEFWDVSMEQEIRTEPRKTTPFRFVHFDCPMFFADGRHLATIGGATINIWDLKTGKRTMTCVEVGLEPFTIGFSPDGQFLLTADTGDTVNVWDLSTGQKQRTIRGLTLCPGVVPGLHVPWGEVPWSVFGAFLVWLALWLFVGYRKRAGSAEPRDLSRYLVVFAALHALGSGLLLLHVYCNSSTARDNAISFLIALAVVPLAVLAVLVVFKRFRSNWFFALGSLLGVLTASGYTAMVLYLRATSF